MATAKYSQLIIAFVSGVIFGALFLSGNIGARKNLNVMPPVSITRESDINVQNINAILRWTSDNFVVLYDIAKVQRGDTLFIVGE